LHPLSFVIPEGNLRVRLSLLLLSPLFLLFLSSIPAGNLLWSLHLPLLLGRSGLQPRQSPAQTYPGFSPWGMLSFMQPTTPDTNAWTCSCCGQVHTTTPFSFAADFPDNYANLNAEERDNRTVISSDQCIIDGSEFWIRGCLEIPIIGSDEVFLWGLWANLFEEDFDIVQAHWETPNRENLIGPFKGRLGNKLTLYPQTSNLKLTVRIQPARISPKSLHR
jgi:hypothetical protein